MLALAIAALALIIFFAPTVWKRQFTLRQLLTWMTIICCVIGTIFAYARAVGQANKDARRAAIKDGRLPPEVIDGVLVTPDQPPGRNVSPK